MYYSCKMHESYKKNKHINTPKNNLFININQLKHKLNKNRRHNIGWKGEILPTQWKEKLLQKNIFGKHMKKRTREKRGAGSLFN